jgi:hypothetical protein
MDLKSRKNTRNKIWPDVEVFLKYRDKTASNSNSILKIKASIDNMGASGMMVLSEDIIPTNTDVEITIDFQPGQKPPNVIHAGGTVVRTENRGFAVKFTRIDTTALGECIMKRLNAKS